MRCVSFKIFKYEKKCGFWKSSTLLVLSLLCSKRQLCSALLTGATLENCLINVFSYINNTTPISVCRSELSVSVIAILDHWKAFDLMKGKFRRLGSTAFNSIWCCLLLLVLALMLDSLRCMVFVALGSLSS